MTTCSCSKNALKMPGDKIFSVSLSILIIGTTVWQIHGGGEGEGSRNFKTFFKNPPYALNVLFSVEESRTRRTEYYWMIWQTDGIIVRKGPTLEIALSQKAYSGRSAAGVYHGEFWMLYEGIIRIFNISNDMATPTNAVSIIKAMPIVYEGKTLINLGIPSVEPGSIQWNEDSFLAKGLDGDMRGKLRGSSNGQVAALDLSFSYLGSTYPSSVVYQYRTNLCIPYLPDRWDYIISQEGSDISLRKYRILSFETNAMPYPPAVFSHRAVLDYDVRGFISFTNDTEVRTKYDRYSDKYVHFAFWMLSPDDIASLWLVSSLAFALVVFYFGVRTSVKFANLSRASFGPRSEYDTNRINMKGDL